MGQIYPTKIPLRDRDGNRNEVITETLFLSPYEDFCPSSFLFLFLFLYSYRYSVFVPSLHKTDTKKTFNSHCKFLPCPPRLPDVFGVRGEGSEGTPRHHLKATTWLRTDVRFLLAGDVRTETSSFLDIIYDLCGGSIHHPSKIISNIKLFHCKEIREIQYIHFSMKIFWSTKILRI